MGAAERMEAVTAEVMAEAAMAAARAEGTVEEDLEEEMAVAAKEEGSAVAKVAAMVVEATVGAMGAPTGEAGAKVAVVLTAALTEVAIDDG